MDKQYAKFMKCGKTVKSIPTGEEYTLVENMDGKKNTVEAVADGNKRRYDLLLAWIRNWEQDSYGFRARHDEKTVDEWRKERQSYVEKLKISDIEPNDVVRFITSDYETKFTVKDLSLVSVDGKPLRVAYIDSHHFTFVACDMSLWSGCFHICEYAELCERNGIEVKPILA